MAETKTLKILSCNNIAPPVEGRCGFFVRRKQRYCKMLPSKGNKFCAEHLNEDKEMNESLKKRRINCPLDPKHTVFEDQLEKHLKKCNATKKTQLPYYSENINLMLQDYAETDEEKIPLHLVPIEELKELITKIRTCYQQCCDFEIAEKCSYHRVLDGELEKTENGPSVRKHLLQQASLVNVLEQSQVLKDNTIIIEFGAGRGALSHWVQKAMHGKQNAKFLLVDRQHNRNRLDCYHKGEDQGPNFERLNIDIQHLDLGNVSSLTDNTLNVAAIGKHLCGGATDLSLKCLLDASTSTHLCDDEPSKKQKHHFLTSRVHTILFALCCYHRCTWNTYVGQHFITNNGFSPTQFSRMTKMAAWSTCGFERRPESDTNEQKSAEKGDDDEHTKNTEEEEDEHGSDDVTADVKLHVGLGLTSDEQRELGRMCKRLVDHGRLLYLRSHGYQCNIIKYIGSDVTPENIALLVTRSPTT